MALEKENIFQITIKEEIDYEEHGIQMDIQIEEATPPETTDTQECPFKNIQLEVKQEINYLLEKELETLKQAPKPVPVNAVGLSTNELVDIKEEENIDGSLVSYDYPNFDDAGSMDSNEATALGNVEACLQEVNIKYETEAYRTHQQNKEFHRPDVKMELSASGIHLTPVSSINQPDEMVNLPLDANLNPPPNIENEEVILPTNTNYSDKITGNIQTNSCIGNIPSLEERNHDSDLEPYHLNSITGNVLSLQQLLKAKKVDTMPNRFPCTECPKKYKTKYQLQRHIGVHRAIERRANGFLRGMQKKKEKLKVKNKTKTPPAVVKPKKSKKKKTPKTNISDQPDTNAKINDQTNINTKKSDEPYTNTRKSGQTNTNVKKEGYECTCGKVFQRRSRMETCLRSHNMCETYSNYIPCVSCSKQFKNKDELATHRKKLHRKRFPCKFCPTDYNTRKELFRHLQIHQKVQLTEYKVISEVMNGKQKLRCFMCSKSWSELSDLKAHVMNNHKGPYVCPHCKNTFPKIIDFANHMKTYHPEVEGQSVLDVLEAFSMLVQAWKCKECELQFLEADKLAMHQIEKHSPDIKTEHQFQCLDCRRVFISQKGLTSHRRIHHSTEPTEEAKVVETGIMCLECRKMCKDINALTSHMRLHSPERKYPCKFCDFRFATPEKRKAHADIHTGDMKYVCFICEYQCSSENRLKQHKMSLKHANIKEYLLTGKPLLEEESTSKTKDSLKKKDCVKKKKKEKSDSSSNCEVSCDICGEKFSSEDKMLEHKQTHPFIEFPNDDKPSRIFFK